jgi:uncharacterized protein YerC
MHGLTQCTDLNFHPQTSKSPITTNMGAMVDALAALEAQKDGEKICYQKIADKYGVERTTLSRCWRRITYYYL